MNFSKETLLTMMTAIAITLFVFVSPALAQAGHPINSVDTSPGTSVPHAMTDPVIDPEKSNDGVIRLPKSNVTSTSEMDKDVDGMKTETKPTRKTSTQQQQQQDKSIFPNERGPGYDPTTTEAE